MGKDFNIRLLSYPKRFDFLYIYVLSLMTETYCTDSSLNSSYDSIAVETLYHETVSELPVFNRQLRYAHKPQRS